MNLLRLLLLAVAVVVRGRGRADVSWVAAHGLVGTSPALGNEETSFEYAGRRGTSSFGARALGDCRA